MTICENDHHLVSFRDVLKVTNEMGIRLCGLEAALVSAYLGIE